MNKDFINEKWLEMKPKIVVLICLVGAFISGYAVGNFGGSPPARRQLNYTTNPVNKPLEKVEAKKPLNTAPKQGSECPIKGSSSKIYHVKGGAFYDRTTGVICFNTEAEAEAAGYRKSSR